LWRERAYGGEAIREGTVMRSNFSAGAAVAAGVVTSLIAGIAHAAEIRVIASAAVKESYQELVAEFEKASNHKVVTLWSGTADIMKRVKAGETADLVILGSNSIDELISLDKVVRGSRTDLMKSGVGVAARMGMPRPDISSGEALKQTLLAAKSIAYSTGPSGVYLDGLFQRMGIAGDLKPKLKQPASGGSVAEMIARGDADIGFQQVSELVHAAGIDYLGPLSPDVQQITVFSSGILMGAAEPAAAKALVMHLSSRAAAPVIRKNGMEPG
jgi:molybdate transport system substrate-binding protein